MNGVRLMMSSSAASRPRKRVLGAASLDGEAKLAGDGQGKIDLGVAEWARPIVIDHELADQLAVREQRNESERADALTMQERFQRRGQIGLVNVVDADRGWLGFLGVPRRMSGEASRYSSDRPRHATNCVTPRSSNNRMATRVQPRAVRTASMPAL